MPERIQRKRVKGWRMPEGAVSVTRPGRWGNPYRIGEVRNYFGVHVEVTEANCLEFFEAHARRKCSLQPGWLEPLRGKDLACFCKPDAPCHADILLRLANS